MTARQLTFDLPAKTALGREDFFVSTANNLAVAMLETWPDWPAQKLVLVGPKGSGKTHLSGIWASETGAVAIAATALAGADIPAFANAPVLVEDIDAIAGDLAAETTLFHLHNLLTANATALLMTSATHPVRLPFGLADLASRLQGTAITEIGPPDDALLAAMLVKLFADRQIAVAPAVVRYLVARMERSFAAAQTLVERLDNAALAEGRAITLPLVARTLDKSGSAGA